MGQVHPLTTGEPAAAPPAPHPAAVRSIDTGHCALCGAKLTGRALRYQVVSPQSCEVPITVCRVCRKAALGEGYRPAE